MKHWCGLHILKVTLSLLDESTVFAYTSLKGLKDSCLHCGVDRRLGVGHFLMLHIRQQEERDKQKHVMEILVKKSVGNAGSTRV